MNNISKSQLIAFAVFVILFCAVTARVTLAQASEEKQYIGWQQCITCHEGYADKIKKTGHTKLLVTDEAPDKIGCEACHGPGSAHLEAAGEKIIKFGELKSEEITSICQKCHFGGHQAGFKSSQHAREKNSCTKCHDIHSTAKDILISPQPKLCLDCHMEKSVSLTMPSRHPIKEGKVKCSDCHNPHQNSKLAMKNMKNVCVNCHQEKAGPFVNEHRPVAENCLNCHQPHGSVNKNLLKFRSPALCLQCHSDAPVWHDSTAKFRNCVNCHKAIHGSNDSSGLGQKLFQ